ncbi:MAG: hypothetical protein JXR10_06960 [Cyclobacteriaceae bacterium]
MSNKSTSNTPRTPIIHVDMDDTIAKYSEAFKQSIMDTPGIKYPQSQYGFFSNLEPLEGALEGIKKLSDLGYDIYILSSPSPKNPLSYTEKRVWIEEHLGYEYVEKLILSMNKGLVKGDYLIDDWTEGRGQENFERRLIQFGSGEFPDWEAVVNYFAGLNKS